MLIAFSRIKNTVLEGTDDKVGTIADLLIDGDSWDVRYIVADSGIWLPGREFLISPTVLSDCDWHDHAARVEMTRDKVRTSPGVDAASPVSRRMERALALHYGWPTYWYGGAVGPAATIPPGPEVATDDRRPIGDEDELPNLRSVSELSGYYLQAADGDLGHIEDLIVDDEAWVIRYIAVDTKNWLPGRKVLVAPDWFTDVSWADATASVDLPQDKIKQAPSYIPTQPINRDSEERLYDFYGRERYWI